MNIIEAEEICLDMGEMNKCIDCSITIYPNEAVSLKELSEELEVPFLELCLAATVAGLMTGYMFYWKHIGNMILNIECIGKENKL